MNYFQTMIINALQGNGIIYIVMYIGLLYKNMLTAD